MLRREGKGRGPGNGGVERRRRGEMLGGHKGNGGKETVEA